MTRAWPYLVLSMSNILPTLSLSPTLLENRIVLLSSPHHHIQSSGYQSSPFTTHSISNLIVPGRQDARPRQEAKEAHEAREHRKDQTVGRSGLVACYAGTEAPYSWGVLRGLFCGIAPVCLLPWRPGGVSADGTLVKTLGVS